MKTSQPAAYPAVALAMSLVLTTLANGATKTPLLPVGAVSAYPTIVRTGTYPTLTWGIGFPTDLKSSVTRDPDGTLTPKEDLQMEVSVIGASNQIGTSSNGTPIYGSVETGVRVGSSSSYTTVFQGPQTSIDPTVPVYTTLVPAYTPVDFHSRSNTGTTWLTYRSTETLTSSVVSLVDGETPPSTVTKKIEPYLAPYLNSSGQVSIGPLDVIYLYELVETTTTKPGFNVQDIVVIVTFSRPKNNNGHGNNLDGVDVSNPGGGSGGPNGEVDPSGIVDDEGKAIKP